MDGVTEGLVSIVIPTYNCAPLLARALRSVLEQTYVNWEAVVIDNHSDDNTEAIVAGFQDARIRLLKTHNNGVIAVSRNMGIGEAKGRWVAFLDADDWWMPHKLEISVRALEQGADIVYHDLLRAGPRRRLLARRVIRTRNLHSPVYTDLAMGGNGLLNSSVLVRRDLLITAGGLSENPRLVAAEDFECWLRLARCTERFQRLSGAHGYYWIGNANTWSSTRTLVCLGELRDRYLGNSPPWLSFALAKANYDLGNFDEARAVLDRATTVGMPRVVRIKTILLKLMLALKNGVQSRWK